MFPFRYVQLRLLPVVAPRFQMLFRLARSAVSRLFPPFGSLSWNGLLTSLHSTAVGLFLLLADPFSEQVTFCETYDAP